MQDKKGLFLSIVIPALNEEKYLPKCLESLKKQTWKDFEIIVSDGGSKDKTVEIAKKSGAKTVVIPDSTVTVARQKGTEVAKGDIIVGADADNIYPINHLEKIAGHFLNFPQTVAIGGPGVFEDKPRWVYLGWKLANLFFGFYYKILKRALYIPAFNLSFRKNVFDQMGGYNTYLDFGGDELDILGRLKNKGKVVFDSSLISYPSSRRAKVGFFRLLFKHTLIDYYLGYFLAKLLKKPVIRGKPVR